MNNVPKISYLLVDDEIDFINRTISVLHNSKNQLEHDFTVEIDFPNITQQYLYHKPCNYKTINTKDNIPERIENVGLYLVKLLEAGAFKDCQGIILDWELSFTDDNGTKYISFEQEELILRVKQLRPQLNIFLLSKTKQLADNIVDTKYITDLFFKPDFDIDPVSSLLRILKSFEAKRTAPFWKAYKDYLKHSIDSWHTPGHNGGASFRKSPFIKDFYEHFGINTFQSDLSVSVDSLGSLLEGNKYIGKAQEKAAQIFGSKKTFFSTNGSSTSNKIIIQSILKDKDKVIVDKNCHKSVHYAIIQSGAIPIYLKTNFDETLGIYSPPALSEVEDKIKNNSDAKLIIITGCTYEGILTDIKQIVALAHPNKMKVFIDEAWFAYAGFHPKFIPYSAILGGADYVTHSSHKVLSAFSQASMIHVNDPKFQEAFFKEVFYIYTSTSPQYQMIASMDVCATQMGLESFELIENSLALANEFRDRANKNLTKFKIIDEDAYREIFPHLINDKSGFDPLKVLIRFDTLKADKQTILNEIRDRAGLEIEKSTNSTFLVLFTIGTERGKMERLLKSLREIENDLLLGATKKQKVSNTEATENDLNDVIFSDGMTPRKAFYSDNMVETNVCDLKDGMISAFLVTPYPPGIPLLIPGQTITNSHKTKLEGHIKEGTEIHALFYSDNGPFIYTLIENNELS